MSQIISFVTVSLLVLSLTITSSDRWCQLVLADPPLTFTLSGTMYRDRVCRQPLSSSSDTASDFSITTSVDQYLRSYWNRSGDGTYTYPCVAVGGTDQDQHRTNLFVRGFCVPDGWQADIPPYRTFLGYYSFEIYLNDPTCSDHSLIGSALSQSTGIDTDACLPLGGVYVKFLDCDDGLGSSNKLKGGIIAAIVISCIVFTCGVCAIGCVIYHRKKRRQAAIRAREGELRVREVPPSAAPAEISESRATHQVPSSRNAATASIYPASPASSYLQMHVMSPGGPPMTMPADADAESVNYTQPQQPFVQPYSPHTPATPLNLPGLYTPPPSFTVSNPYPIAAASSVRVVVCSRCGPRLADSGRFCSHCGSQLESNSFI